MKYLSFVLIAFSTFLLGCVLTRLHRSVDQPIPSAFIVQVQPERKDLLDGIVEGGRGCGNGYGQGYVLPDGKKMGEGNSCYDSFEQALREMNSRLKTADRIIERSASSGFNGKSRSERIVAAFPRDEFGNEWVGIMWVDEYCIHWINGPTLEHALAFEKSKLNPSKFED